LFILHEKLRSKVGWSSGRKWGLWNNRGCSTEIESRRRTNFYRKVSQN